MSWSTSELRVMLAPWDRFKPSNKIFLLTVPRRYFFRALFVFFMSCDCHAFASVHCWLLFVMFDCVFVTSPCGILGQVWYLIVSIPDLCRISYFNSVVHVCSWTSKGGRLSHVMQKCIAIYHRRQAYGLGHFTKVRILQDCIHTAIWSQNNAIHESNW